MTNVTKQTRTMMKMIMMKMIMMKMIMMMENNKYRGVHQMRLFYRHSLYHCL